MSEEILTPARFASRIENCADGHRAALLAHDAALRASLAAEETIREAESDDSCGALARAKDALQSSEAQMRTMREALEKWQSFVCKYNNSAIMPREAWPEWGNAIDAARSALTPPPDQPKPLSKTVLRRLALQREDRPKVETPGESDDPGALTGCGDDHIPRAAVVALKARLDSEVEHKARALDWYSIRSNALRIHSRLTNSRYVSAYLVDGEGEFYGTFLEAIEAAMRPAEQKREGDDGKA